MCSKEEDNRVLVEIEKYLTTIENKQGKKFIDNRDLYISTQSRDEKTQDYK